jgi:NAD(P)-dependent dehydrogenase (short-subunit alcohol dehydrogenase family)
MISSSVEGKTAVVTGGGSGAFEQLVVLLKVFTNIPGIGLAFVGLLLKNGCNVVIGDLQLTPDAQKLVDSSSSPKALFEKTDVTNWTELTDRFTFTERELGSPDIVCPGAGIFEPK